MIVNALKNECLVTKKDGIYDLTMVFLTKITGKKIVKETT